MKHPFNKDAKMTGYDWCYGLKKINSYLRIRKPDITSAHRISAFNTESVGLVFNNLTSTTFLPSLS